MTLNFHKTSLPRALPCVRATIGVVCWTWNHEHVRIWHQGQGQIVLIYVQQTFIWIIWTMLTNLDKDMKTCCGLDFIRQLVRDDYVEIMDWWTLFWETFFSTLVECTFLLLTMTDLAPGPVNFKFDLPIMWNIRRLITERLSKHGYVWWKIIVKIMLLILFRLMDSSVREYCKLWYCMEWLHVLETE